MTELSYRQKIKKNELADFIISLVEWTRSNLTLFFTILGSVLGVSIFALFFFLNYNQIKVAASDKLSIAQGTIAQGGYEQGTGLINELIDRYPKTRSAFQARIVKANYLTSQMKYDEAEQTILPVILNGKPETIKPLALAAYCNIQENAGKFQEAAKSCNDFLETYPDHFMVPSIYESLGRVQELAGLKQDAASTYEKIVTLYPATEWAQRAQERISFILGRKDK